MIESPTIDGGGGTSRGGTFSLSGRVAATDGALIMRSGNFSLSGDVPLLVPAVREPITPGVRHDWNGRVSGNWSDTGNWSPSTVPKAGDSLFFLANAVRKMITNDLPRTVFGSITVAGGDYVIQGNPLVLGWPGAETIFALGGLTNSMHVDLILNGPVTIRSAVVQQKVRMFGNVNLGSHRLTVQTDGELNCSGAISGTGGITKIDNGRLVFSGASPNSYSGSTIISQGTLELNKSIPAGTAAGQTGAVAVPGELQIGVSENVPERAAVIYGAPNQLADIALIYIRRTGELNLTNHQDTVRMADLSGGDINTGVGILTVNDGIRCARGDVSGSAISGNLVLGGETVFVDVQTDTFLNISAIIESGPANMRFQKVGPGELRLSGKNIYTALTHITEGTLRVTTSGGLGDGLNDVVLDGGKLALVNAGFERKKLVASAPGVISVEGQVIWSGPMNLAGAVVIDTPLADTTFLVPAVLEGLGGFVKTGPGLLRLEGTEPNTYQGGATFIQGGIELAKSAGVPALHGPLTVGDNSTVKGKAVLRYVNADQISDDTHVTVERSGRITMRDRAEALGGLAGAGEVQLGNGTLVVGQKVLVPAVMPPFTGEMSGTGRLIKTGNNTMTMSGANTYTGETIVEDGTLLLDGLMVSSLLRVQGVNSTLGGNGTMQKVHVFGGNVSPGASAGTLSVTDFQMTNGALNVELNETTVYDRVVARGNVILSGALNVILRFAPALAESFRIVEKTSSGPISGTFDGMPEGARFPANGTTFQITYRGGTGNDVVLTPVGLAPALLCPSNLVVETASSSGTNVSFAPVPMNFCSGNVTIVCTPPSGSVFPVGRTTVNCTATADCGSTASCSFVVEVRRGGTGPDTQPPQLVSPPRIIVPCDGPGGTVVKYHVDAVDDSDPNPVITCKPPSGSLFPPGTNSVTCEAVDSAGNRSSSQFPIIVLGGCGTDDCLEITVPADMHVRRESVEGARVTFALAARDSCSGGTLSITSAPPSGSIFPVGRTRVVCRTTSADRPATTSFIVEVFDDAAPEIICPANLIVAAESLLGAIVNFSVTGKDDSTSTVRVRSSPPSGSLFPVGVTRVLSEATDGNGNVSQCIFTVAVTPPPPLQVASARPDRIEMRWIGEAIVEFTDALTENTIWSPVTNEININGSERLLALGAAGGNRFFRLCAAMSSADSDGDGVSDVVDQCPSTPASSTVDEHGCSQFDLLATPNLALEPAMKLVSDTMTNLRQLGSFANALGQIEPYVEPYRMASSRLRQLDFGGALDAQSGLVQQLRAAQGDFRAQKVRLFDELLQKVTPADPIYADVRREDLEMLDWLDAEEALDKAVAASEKTLSALSGLATAAASPRKPELVTIQSFDTARGSATLTDGRTLFVRSSLESGTPSPSEVQGAYTAGSQVNIDASSTEGAVIGHEADSALGVAPYEFAVWKPKRLRFVIVPARPGLPDSDIGVRHHVEAYSWPLPNGTRRLDLEHGMGFAAQRAPLVTDPGYEHWLAVGVDGNRDGFYHGLVQLRENAPPFVITQNELPLYEILPLRVREFRARIIRAGELGQSEFVDEEFYIARFYPVYAVANYDRTIFEIEDDPETTKFQAARVTSLTLYNPLLTKPPNELTFRALSFRLSGNASSYPTLLPVGLNEPFAVHYENPTSYALYTHRNEERSGLHAMTVNGFNNGYPFTYRVKPTPLVRDRITDCVHIASELPDCYYRIPIFAPQDWQVSQANDGAFTHNGLGRYAFDFPKPTGLQIVAARGGVVTNVRESSSQSCWDPSVSACVNCMGASSPNRVQILHQDGTVGVYVHFRQNGVVVTTGQRIYRGEAIGYVGNTGCSTGPHLHFEVVDPSLNSSPTIMIRFETFDAESEFENCYLPGHNSSGFSNNKPWWAP